MHRRRGGKKTKEIESEELLSMVKLSVCKSIYIDR